ncbi:NAD-dependent epimerase/dehydratase family protein [Alsobacter sp. R-9]
MSRTVVITGATGNLGVKLRRHFEGLGWTLRLTDVRDGGDPRVVAADLSVWDERWVSTFKDADAVLLLAGDPSPAATWASVQRLNLDLPMNVYEAAARQGAKRVIFASSNWTMAGHRFHGGALPTERDPYPVNAYGMSKLVAERMGRSYWDRWGLSVICFRIGYCQRGENKPGPHMGWSDWGQEMWLSDRDLCEGFEKAVTAPQSVGFQVLNLMSDNPGMRWDIETTKRTIGYAPRDGHRASVTPEQQRGAVATRRTREMLEAAEQWLQDTRY